MAPTLNQLHVDTLLGNVSVRYRNNEFVAKEIFPVIPVKKSSDLFRQYSREFRVPETIRAIGGISKEVSFEVSTSSYVLEWHALKDYVADRQAENYDLADLRVDTTENLTDIILRRMEKSVMDLFTKTGWSLNVSLAAANAFSANTTVSNPIPIFDTGASTVIANSGKKPNYGLMNRDTFVACKNHVSVLDRTKYVSAEMDVDMLAALFGLEKLHVSLASVDTAAPGQAASISALLGPNAFLGWKPANPGPLQPSAGYIFQNARPLVKRWRVEEREADCIEVNVEYQAKVVGSLCGYLICGTL
jgi:hypothetical protein